LTWCKIEATEIFQI